MTLEASQDTAMTDKGEEIRIIKGAYVGNKAWLDRSRAISRESKFMPVIVLLKAEAEDEEDTEIQTRVKKNGVRKLFGVPTCLEAAALVQHPDIEKTMAKLAEMWSEIREANTRNVLLLFEAELTKAIVTKREEGSKGRYRYVDYTNNDDDDVI